jgi:thioredoxin 1
LKVVRPFRVPLRHVACAGCSFGVSMNQPMNSERASSRLVLIVGLVLGGSLLVFMARDSIAQFFGKGHSGSAYVVTLTNDNWQKEVVESKIPVMVDFWGPGCAPCEMLAPTIAKLAERYQGKIKVGKLNVAENRKTAVRYKIDPIPTVLLFKGGEERKAFIGVEPESVLANAIDRALQ